MKMMFTFLLLLILSAAHSQLLTWTPDFITETSVNDTITGDAAKGNQGLLNYDPNDVYVHIGVITSTSGGLWTHVPFTWATTPAAAHALPAGNNKWKYGIAGNLRTFFNVTNPAEKILKVAILFRNGDGSKKLANTDGNDMYVPVYDDGLQARITQPYSQPEFVPEPEPLNYAAGDAVSITAKASIAANLQLLYNGSPIASAANATTITATTPAVSGNNQIVVSATSGVTARYDTINFFVNTPVITKDLPAGVQDGINYGADGTSATLVLYAPEKTRAAVIGEFNNWTQTATYQMYRTPDGNRYWITLVGLVAGQEYAYQYLVDGNLKVADMYAEKILDKDNDPYIPAVTYPNLKTYPAGQSGIVSILQTSKPAYAWQVQNFAKPDKRNLVIYELLVRDFVASHNWQTVKDSIGYLKKLGINTIEVMPFSEFEGNISWGYNPDFFFAPDKYYGTDVTLKQFIDECHKQGIAVVMDMVMNHAFGSSPTVQLYFDAANNRPAANNPWHNPVATHPYSVGYDFNHESPATQYLVNRVVQHWLQDYKIDGFRWDLSKGFTQTNSGDNVNLWGQYDASRVTTWKRIYDEMQTAQPGSYCILEHFAENREEDTLSNYGMLLWGNENYNYNQATMGFDNSDFGGGIYTTRGYANPNLVTYMESHDEERLMFKNEQCGNSKKDGSYNIKNIPTGLKRNEMAAAFWAMQPAPKMVWQFGELGYDYSINRCEDGTTNDNCRTSPKPIHWDYMNDANRAALRNVYARLFALRNYAAYLPAFTAPKDSITWNLSGNFKWEKINSAPLDIAVIGNFDTAVQIGAITFSHTGVWYDYLNNTAFTVVGTTQNYTLQPGEYHVFIDQNASVVLPAKLLSFTAGRTPGAINLTWTTTNEINLKQFVVERSLDGRNFTAIGTVAAKNAVNTYRLGDAEAAAINAPGDIYYQLQMADKDGSFTYSEVVKVAPSGSRDVIIYPNPVKTGVVYVKLTTAAAGTIWISITDATGKICNRQSLQLTGSNTKVPVNTSALASGIYTIRIDGVNKNSITQKLVVQR